MPPKEHTIIKELASFFGKKFDALAEALGKKPEVKITLDLTETNQLLAELAQKQSEPLEITVDLILK